MRIGKNGRKYAENAPFFACEKIKNVVGYRKVPQQRKVLSGRAKICGERRKRLAFAGNGRKV